MTLVEAVQSLVDAFPNAKITEGTVAQYVADLEDMPEELVVAAINRLRRTEREWMPTIAKIRELVAEAVLNIPSEEEAWTSVRDALGTKDWDDVHSCALEAVKIVSAWALRTDEKGYAKRDFMAAYAKAREARIKALQSGVTASLENALGEG